VTTHMSKLGKGLDGIEFQKVIIYNKVKQPTIKKGITH
jgi:hypothetical protein